MSAGLLIVLIVVAIVTAILVLLAVSGKSLVTTDEIQAITVDFAGGDMIADTEIDDIAIWLYRKNKVTDYDAREIKKSGAVNLAMIARKKSETTDPGSVIVKERDMGSRSFVEVKGKHTFGAFIIVEDGSKKTIFTPYSYDKKKDTTIGISTEYMIMDATRFGKYKFYIKVDAIPTSSGEPQHTAFFEISYTEADGYHLRIPNVAKDHVEGTGDRWYVEKVRLFSDGRFHKLKIVYF